MQLDDLGFLVGSNRKEFAMTTAHEALEKLQRGNERYLSGTRIRSALEHRHTRGQLSKGQTPFAVVLSCSDSRVPPEIVFDQDLGDLFVIRVAGNIVEPSQIASVEYAVGVLGTKLVVVMGHTGCGAVLVTVQAIEDPSIRPSIHMEAIVNRIETAVRGRDDYDVARNLEDKCDITGLANIANSVERLMLSELLQAKAQSGDVLFLGSIYEMDTGVVRWLD